MVAWTTAAMVAEDLGPGAGDAFLAAPNAPRVVGAANVVCYRKRAEAGYADPNDATAPAPDDAVASGATLYAVALWRERASTDGYASMEDLSSFTPTGGAWGQIKRLLGIGRAQVDAPLGGDAAVAAYRARRAGLWRRYL